MNKGEHRADCPDPGIDWLYRSETARFALDWPNDQSFNGIMNLSEDL